MTLKSLLLENKNSRKIFGLKEIEIILKQISGKNLTQSEKNRLSRDIRPKFEIIEELSEFQDEFKIKKSQDNKKEIKKAVEIILKDELKNEIKSILLYGSIITKSFHQNSDIDICVLFKKELSLKEATMFRIRVMGELSSKFDVQVFNNLPQKIKREIMKNHRILFRTKGYDDINESISFLKDDDYFIRLKDIYGDRYGQTS